MSHRIKNEECGILKYCLLAEIKTSSLLLSQTHSPKPLKLIQMTVWANPKQDKFCLTSPFNKIYFKLTLKQNQLYAM